MNRKVLTRRSTWLPAVLAIYMLVITTYNAGPWIESGHTIRLILSIVFELLIILALYLMLRKKESYKERRDYNCNRGEIRE